MDARDWPAIRRRLLQWYSTHHRAMQWRPEPGKAGDPYAVLVSESMLQQTQVATVVPYFQRFMARFPTLRCLATADEQDVLAAWQGLGYYRRARSLHAAAKVIVDVHNGCVPGDFDAILALPGVGRYTAGAIASIAFGQRRPVVDGNVSRVLSRITGDTRYSDDRGANADHWAIMSRLVVMRGRYGPGDVNQAVMELGATVCTPRGPDCGACPLRSTCVARALGDPVSFGSRQRRAVPTEMTHHVIAVERGGRWMFERRPDRGLWAGMWQMPTWEPGDGGPNGSRHGVALGPAEHIGSFVHNTTHRRVRFEVHAARAQGGRLRTRSAIWRRLDDLADIPLSAAQRRVTRLVDDIDRA